MKTEDLAHILDLAHTLHLIGRKNAKSRYAQIDTHDFGATVSFHYNTKEEAKLASWGLINEQSDSYKEVTDESIYFVEGKIQHLGKNIRVSFIASLSPSIPVEDSL